MNTLLSVITLTNHGQFDVVMKITLLLCSSQYFNNSIHSVPKQRLLFYNPKLFSLIFVDAASVTESSNNKNLSTKAREELQGLSSAFTTPAKVKLLLLSTTENNLRAPKAITKLLELEESYLFSIWSERLANQKQTLPGLRKTNENCIPIPKLPSTK